MASTTRQYCGDVCRVAARRGVPRAASAAALTALRLEVETRCAEVRRRRVAFHDSFHNQWALSSSRTLQQSVILDGIEDDLTWLHAEWGRLCPFSPLVSEIAAGHAEVTRRRVEANDHYRKRIASHEVKQTALLDWIEADLFVRIVQAVITACAAATEVLRDGTTD